MGAAEFAPDSMCLAAGSGGGLRNHMFAVVGGGATMSILVITLVISAFDSQHAARAAKHAESLQPANEQLRNIALYDNLTGLPNRLLFEDRMEQAMVRSGRSGKPCALMFVDLDNFKPVNDSFGHRVGDALLKSVGGRLANCGRKEDTVARAGGDEFIVALSELAKGEDAAVIGRRILQQLSQPFTV